MTQKEFNFTIGADPEFNLIMQGRKVDAKQTLMFAFQDKNKKEITPSNMGYQVKDSGEFGWDGRSSTAELRPAPAKTPHELVANMSKVLKTISKHIKMFNISTLSEFDPIGGHIHFEIPKGVTWTTEKRNSIHRKMASFYMPILLSENKVNLNLRIRQGYGSLKDNRIQEMFKYPDGTRGFTYEFRCPSSEWMTTPKIALSVLAYMSVVYHEIINRPRSFCKYSDIVYKNDKQGDALQTLAVMDYNLLTTQILTKIKKYIKNFEMYEHYKTEIDYIFKPEQILKEKNKMEYNLSLGWELDKQNQVVKKKEITMSKTKFSKIKETKNLDDIKKVMNIYSNDDTNVVLFTEALKDRVSTFNWKLKNNYYIFGIRKGIDKMIIRNFTGEFLAGEDVIKTQSDLTAVEKLFGRMKQKFSSITHIPPKSLIIDFKTGKPKNPLDSSLLIGLPYEMRTKENLTPFLEAIWDIENNKLVPSTFSEKATKNLTDDLFEADSKKGNVYQILTASPSTQNPPVAFTANNPETTRRLEAISNEIQQQEREEAAFTEEETREGGIASEISRDIENITT